MILPISIGLFTWKNQTKSIRYFIFGLFLIALILLFSSLITKFGIKNSLFLNYLSSVVDYIFLCLCFGLPFKSKLTQKVIYTSLIFVCIVTIVDAFYISGYKNSTAISSNIKSIFVVLLVTYYIICLFRTSKDLMQNPLFLIAIIALFTTSIGMAGDLVLPYLANNRLINEQITLYCFLFSIYGIGSLLKTIPIWRASQDSKFARLQV